jgi:sugar phosphate isomerase/epimerase
MKLAFSTLGCPNWKLEQILEAARENGYAGVELRFYDGSFDLLTKLAEVPDGPEGFARRFADAGVEICAVGSSVVLSKQEDDLSEAERMIELTAQLSAPYMRVFGGHVPEGESLEACRARSAAKLARLGRYGQERGVRVLLETHDAFITGEAVAGLLAQAGDVGTGVIWDLRHPYANGEAPARTAELIGSRTYHAHIKDERKDGTMTLLGEGEVPLRELLGKLRDLGFGGYVSFEWEKAWHPEIPDPEIAIPHAARYLKGVLEELGIRR